MRLPLAEDDPKLLKSLKYIFETNKFAVDAVGNGEDALQYALSDEYDGLVLDIMMPGLDGIQAVAKTRYYNPGFVSYGTHGSRATGRRFGRRCR